MILFVHSFPLPGLGEEDDTGRTSSNQVEALDTIHTSLQRDLHRPPTHTWRHRP
jgi:hypothetical protein